MTIGRFVNRLGWLFAVLAIATPWTSANAAGTEFARFLATAKRYCAEAPAQACIDRLWPIADRNRDGVLELGEVQALDEDALAWAKTVDRSHRDRERDTTLMVLAVLNQAGLTKVFDSFDSNHDGVVTRAELFADFRFDKRPFRKLVLDPAAVDWHSFGHHFGPIGMLLASLLPAPPPRQATESVRR